MKILFLSDFVPIKNIRLGEDFKRLFREADKVLFNLEGSPLTGSDIDYQNQIMPFNIDEFLAFIKQFGKSKFVVALANNHILDNGDRGFNYLIKKLEAHSISYFGTKNKPFIDIDGEVSVLNFVTAETVARHSSRKKLNYLFYDPSTINKQIKELEKKGTDLVLYPHWGRDMDRTTFKTYDFDLNPEKWTTFGHHPHVIGEIKPNFIYSLGNTFIPHPNYYKRFKAVKYGLAALYDTENREYELKLTGVFSEDGFENNFQIKVTDFDSLPREILSYNKDFSPLKKVVLNLFSFKGNIFDCFKLYALQYLTVLFKMRNQIFSKNNSE